MIFPAWRSFAPRARSGVPGLDLIDPGQAGVRGLRPFLRRTGILSPYEFTIALAESAANGAAASSRLP